MKLDALLMSDQALQELAKAMVVISDCHCKLHLCINKLGVTCNGAKKTAVLLREIDHQVHGGGRSTEGGANGVIPLNY